MLRHVGVLEVPQLDHEVNLFLAHRLHRLLNLRQGIAVDARAQRRGICIVNVGDDSELYKFGSRRSTSGIEGGREKLIRSL